jgi:hypothetical protein
MKKNLILFLMLPLISFSQELKKSDFLGEWLFKEMILISKTGRDSIKNNMHPSHKFEDKDLELIISPSDMKFTEHKFYKKKWNKYYKGYKDAEFEFYSNLWKITKNNEIVIHESVPKNEIEYYKKYTFNIIEKLDNGKYYFQKPKFYKIIKLEEDKFIYKDVGYKYIFERK